MSDGEEWKGEPSIYRGFSIWGGRELTEEEMAAYAKQVEEAAARAEAAWLTLPHYVPLERCVKCGSINANKVRHSSVDAYCPSGIKQEHGHLHVRCRQCKYRWCRKALDAEAP